MNNPTLFMLMLGCKPIGRYTEQHDTFFTIANSIIDTENDAKLFWPDAGKIHVDAWRQVTIVGNYEIKVAPRSQVRVNTKRLFFLNLGGYKKR